MVSLRVRLTHKLMSLRATKPLSLSKTSLSLSPLSPPAQSQKNLQESILGAIRPSPKPVYLPPKPSPKTPSTCLVIIKALGISCSNKLHAWGYSTTPPSRAMGSGRRGRTCELVNKGSLERCARFEACGGHAYEIKNARYTGGNRARQELIRCGELSELLASAVSNPAGMSQEVLPGGLPPFHDSFTFPCICLA